MVTFGENKNIFQICNIYSYMIVAIKLNSIVGHISIIFSRILMKMNTFISNIKGNWGEKHQFFLLYAMHFYTPLLNVNLYSEIIKIQYTGLQVNCVKYGS